MTVWIVEVKYHYEAGFTIGVFSTEEKAKLGMIAFIKRHGYPVVSDCEILEWTVDSIE